MTKEEATKILAEMLKADTNRTFLGQSERCAIIYAMQDMNRRPEKPKPQPIYITDDGKIIPLPEPQALPLPDDWEDWKAGAELCRMINANIDARIKHFFELERERKEGAKDDI